MYTWQNSIVLEWRQEMKSLAPHEKSMCDLLGPTTGNYKAFAWQASQRKAILLTQDLVYSLSFSEGSCGQGLDLWASHAHKHICIPRPTSPFRGLLSGILTKILLSTLTPFFPLWVLSPPSLLPGPTPCP